MSGGRTLAASLALAAAIEAAGCGYTLVGKTSTLPPSVRVIHFQTLANATSRVGLEQRLSREVARELASRGRFSVKADATGAEERDRQVMSGPGVAHEDRGI